MLRFGGPEYSVNRKIIKEVLSRELGSGAVPEGNYSELPFVAVRDPHCKLTELAFPVRVKAFPPVRIDHARALITLGLDAALHLQVSIENEIEVNGFARLVDGWKPGMTACYPALDFKSTPPLITSKPELSIPTRHGRLAAINLSLGTDELSAPHTEDPVNLATRFASLTVPVVVAAGNNGYISSGDDTMNTWARSSTVISVGATTSPEGGELAVFSSVGSKRHRHLHPTIAAYGASALDDRKKGTSFAAPRVCRQLIALVSYWQVIASQCAALRGSLQGVPLPWTFFVDSNITGNMYRPNPALPALPPGATDTSALRYLIEQYEFATGLPLDVTMTPPRLRRMLIASARPIAGLSRREIGAGFVNNDTTLDYLSSITAASLLRILDPTRAQQHPQLVKQLNQVSVSVPRELPAFLEVWTQSNIQSGWDIGPYAGTLASETAPLAVTG
jgi:hypothetical protein